MPTKNTKFISEDYLSISAENRDVRHTLRFTRTEDKRLHQEFETSGLSKYTQYMRQKLLTDGLEKTIIYNRHQKKMLHEIAQLKTSTNKIGNNFNQLMTAINTFKVVNLSASELSNIQQVGMQLEQVKILLEQLINQELESI